MGGAALLWTATAAVPTAVTLRAWRCRGARAPVGDGARGTIGKPRAGEAVTGPEPSAVDGRVRRRGPLLRWRPAATPLPRATPVPRGHDDALESYDVLPLDPPAPGSAASWQGDDSARRARWAVLKEAAKGATEPKGTVEPEEAADREEAAGPEEAKADNVKADGVKTDGVKTDGARTDGARTDGARTDATKAEDTKADGITEPVEPPPLPGG
ncbi:hypothetical protein C1I97_38410, partial [Streptomyces sp. NTH33]